jgi:methylenetetrahydrofolate reductase (NADPH)
MRFSYEIFPPKTERGLHLLTDTLVNLRAIRPTLVSVTYGAGGGEQQRSFDAIHAANAAAHCPIAGHLTCVGMSRDDVNLTIDRYLDLGISHIVTLRGDPPEGIDAPYRPHPDGYSSTADLVSAAFERAKERSIELVISVSAYPEVHPQSASMAHDLDVMEAKVAAGATRAMTQMFFSNAAYLNLREAVAERMPTVQLVPGIMPVHSFERTVAFARRCGASVPDKFLAHFDGAVPGSPDERSRSVDWTTSQIADLQRNGVEEFHLYTLNSAELVLSIVTELRGERDV